MNYEYEYEKKTREIQMTLDISNMPNLLKNNLGNSHGMNSYPILMLIAKILWILGWGWMIGIVGMIVLIVYNIFMENFPFVLEWIILFPIQVFGAIIMFAISECIKLFVNIANDVHNIKKTSEQKK